MRSRKTDIVKLVWTWALALLAALVLQNEAYAAKPSEISLDEIFDGGNLFFHSTPLNYYDIKLITNNTDAFKVKLEMIKEAKQNIDIVYFIWESDYTSSLLMQNLMLKADEGIKVRVLVDYMETESQVNALLTMANHLSNATDQWGRPIKVHNIDVKRFRPPSKRLMELLHKDGINENLFIHALMILDKPAQEQLLASVRNSSKIGAVVQDFAKKTKALDLTKLIAFILELFKREAPATFTELTNFLKRSHYKLLLTDDKKFLVGGRNISDQYHTEGGSPFLQRNEFNDARYTFQDTELEATEGEPDSNQSSQKDAFTRLWNFQDNVYASDSNYYYDEKGQTLPPQLPETEIFRRAGQAHLLKYDDGILTNSTLNVPGPVPGQIFENPASTVEWSPMWGQWGRVYNRIVLAREIAREYLRLIKAARHRIDIVTAYFYIDSGFSDREYSEIFNALKEKAKAGVKVTVFTNSPLTTDLAIVNFQSYRTYKDLEDSNIKIYELAPDQGSLHTKVMTVDDDILAVGSFNLDPRSQISDTNNIIVLKDYSLVHHFREERGVPNSLKDFDEEIKNSKTLKWFAPATSFIEEKKLKLDDNIKPIINQIKSLI